MRRLYKSEQDKVLIRRLDGETMHSNHKKFFNTSACICFTLTFLFTLHDLSKIEC